MNDRPPIRQAGAADVLVVQEIVTAAYDKYLVRMDRPPAPMLRDYAPAVEAGTLWVTGEPVTGLISLIPEGDSLLIENLAVRPEAQGTGVGRALMDFAELGRPVGADAPDAVHPRGDDGEPGDLRPPWLQGGGAQDRGRVPPRVHGEAASAGWPGSSVTGGYAESLHPGGAPSAPGPVQPILIGRVRGPRIWPADQVTAAGSSRVNAGIRSATLRGRPGAPSAPGASPGSGGCPGRRRHAG